MCLLRLPLPCSWANEGFLGVTLGDLVGGQQAPAPPPRCLDPLAWLSWCRAARACTCLRRGASPHGGIAWTALFSHPAHDVSASYSRPPRPPPPTPHPPTHATHPTPYPQPPRIRSPNLPPHPTHPPTPAEDLDVPLVSIKFR